MGDGDSNVTGNITSNIINAMRGFTVTENRPRPAEHAKNARGQGRPRAGVPYLLRATTSGAINDQKPVIKFDDGFDGGIQSKSAHC